MGRTASGSDGFGREVILGLLAEEPSCAYQLDRRLSERFGSAGYTNGMANKTVKRLHRDGLARPVGPEVRAAADGMSRAASVVYEATPAGIDHFRRWMWASVSTPPVREELHAKIALCRPDETSFFKKARNCSLFLNGLLFHDFASKVRTNTARLRSNACTVSIVAP